MDRVKPKMFVMTGIPGSGKTTVAKQFAEKNGFRYIGIDDFYKSINGSDTIREHKFDVWMACFRAIHLAEKDRADVVVDTNAPNSLERSDFVRWFRGYSHHLIWVCADVDLCRARNRSRSRVIPEEDMDKLIDEYKRPDLRDFDMWDSMAFIRSKEEGFSKPQSLTDENLLPELEDLTIEI